MESRRVRRGLIRVACVLAFGGCAQTPPPRAPARIEPDLSWPPPELVQEGLALPGEPPLEPKGRGEPVEPAVEPLSELAAGDVVVFREGKPDGVITRHEAEARGLFLLDLGSGWVPRLFRSTPDVPHDYERVFADLSNARFDEGPEGRRAAQERYLEPHGIPPSPALLARRFRYFSALPCARSLPLDPLRDFGGATWEEGAPPPPVPETIVLAVQARLACEQHLRKRPNGELDEDTRLALEEFERRNRIYARASLKGETLDALRAETLELERRALWRVLVERMILDLGVVEDASAFGAWPKRERGKLEVEQAPDVVSRIQRRVLEAFGLATVRGVERFYRRFGSLLENSSYTVAIDSVELPEYYSDDMDLWVEIDRGDLYYEFPFDDEGKPLAFPIERGPTMTLFARDGERVRPLVLYPTTIGGWRVRRSGAGAHWEYKESPVGQFAWQRIVTAPVWIPPHSTPAETLIVKLRRISDGSEFYELNRNLIGPSFASAYGLVAAYHQRLSRSLDGDLEVGGDDGIRTHGSSEYTSIWRTVSSGCHRLHNHLAMRLFNFVLAHRAHRRVGHRQVNAQVHISNANLQATVTIPSTGYEFNLARPLEVSVLPGRIRGQQKRPLKRYIPAAEEESERPTPVFMPKNPGPS